MTKILYITQSGKLSRKDNTLFFENENVRKIIPIEGIEDIYCLGEISFNSKLLIYLSQCKINLHQFNYYGFYSGTFYPKEAYVSGKLLVEQVNAYTNLPQRLEIAKNIVKSICLNCVFVLRHYYKHGVDLGVTIQRLEKNFAKEINFQNTITQLLKIEGGIWDIFYRSFKKILPQDFTMNNRVKRPPDNPINALISFGNSLLYTQVLSQIYHTQLNPTISYLHEPFERRFSLALDLAETWKPIIVFKTIFKLINKRIIKIDDFRQELNFCYLNENGRKKFLQEFDRKLNETIKHPKLKRKVSYRTLIRLDCFKLIKYLLKEQEFQPFIQKICM